ncbi:MAG: Fur family transcriptional regulator [Muribaculaceae bacterium]
MTATDNLIKHGIRPSLQRIAVMKYLMEHKTHPTVDEIYLALVKDMPTLSKTTVYNTLQLLVSNQAALELTIDPKQAHYDSTVAMHSHFYCKKCNRIYDVELSSEIIDALQPKMGFLVEGTQVYYTGVCDKCRNKTENN